jgi:hypothetical protein
MEEVSAAWKAITRSSSKSVQLSAQQVGVSTSSTWEICHDDGPLFPYKNLAESAEDGIVRWYSSARE